MSGILQQPARRRRPPPAGPKGQLRARVRPGGAGGPFFARPAGPCTRASARRGQHAHSRLPARRQPLPPRLGGLLHLARASGLEEPTSGQTGASTAVWSTREVSQALAAATRRGHGFDASVLLCRLLAGRERLPGPSPGGRSLPTDTPDALSGVGPQLRRAFSGRAGAGAPPPRGRAALRPARPRPRGDGGAGAGPPGIPRRQDRHEGWPDF